MRRAFTLYLLILSLATILGGSVVMIVLIAGKSLSCDQTDAGPGRFLSYCINDAMGDYDHGAYYYGLEPKAIASLRRATVAIMGNSHAEVGFSTESTTRYFAVHKLPYYTFSFTYGEGSDFPLAIMRRDDIKPRLLIINADPFFTTPGPVGQEILDGGVMENIHYRFKQAALKIDHQVCAFAPRLCSNQDFAAYRSGDDGQLLIKSAWSNAVKPFTPDMDKADEAAVAAAAAQGKKFLSALSIPRACVILTGVPAPDIKAADMAKQLAHRLGTPYLNIAVPNMATMDGGHLNRDTAERWSAAFLQAITPIVEKCTAPAAEPPASPN